MQTNNLKALANKLATPEFATALSADKDESAVKVVAHARGSDVNPMLELARQHQIPVVQDFSMSNALRSMPPGTLIPNEVFQSVSVILDFMINNEKVLEAEFQDSTDDSH